MAGPGASSKKLASRPARTSSWTSGRLAGSVTTGPTTGGGRCACGRGGAATGGRGGDDLVAGRAMPAGEGLGAPRGAPRPSPAGIARPATRSSPPRPPVAAPPRPQAQRPPPVVGPVVTLPASLPLVQDDVLAGLDASFFDDAPGPAIPSPKRARVA